jgi:hypothetical protein
MLPFGVVIPTKNSMKYLPDHVRSLSTWIDLAEQVVVVDSFSEDGTVDYLRKNLQHPNVHFLSHPPGLYASWNHAIRQLQTTYCYISTIGDSLTRAGAEHLVATATRLQCDVLVSCPDFVDEAGQPCLGPLWPMPNVIRELELKKPCRLPAIIMMITALRYPGNALTGSCASDLFRTATLQQFPFPLEFGVVGDGVWSMERAGDLIWAATPEKISTFRLHPPTASPQEIKGHHTGAWHMELGLKKLNEWLPNAVATVSEPMLAEIKKLALFSQTYLQNLNQYDAHRKRTWPWSLNPAAWRARYGRNQARRHISEIHVRIINHAKSLLKIAPERAA